MSQSDYQQVSSGYRASLASEYRNHQTLLQTWILYEVLTRPSEGATASSVSFSCHGILARQDSVLVLLTQPLKARWLQRKLTRQPRCCISSTQDPRKKVCSPGHDDWRLHLPDGQSCWPAKLCSNPASLRALIVIWKPEVALQPLPKVLS